MEGFGGRPNSERDPRLFATLLLVAKTCAIGAIGGAFCGFMIIVVETLLSGGSTIDQLGYVAAVGGIAAIFGAPFGVVAFPICYLTFARAVPFKDVLLYAIPFTVGGELLYAASGYRLDLLPSWGTWVDLYAGGLLGLLVASIVAGLVETYRTRASR